MFETAQFDQLIHTDEGLIAGGSFKSQLRILFVQKSSGRFLPRSLRSGKQYHVAVDVLISNVAC